MSVSISHAVRHTRTKAANAPRSMPGATTVPQQRLYVSGQGTGCMAPSKTSLVVAGNGTGHQNRSACQLSALAIFIRIGIGLIASLRVREGRGRSDGSGGDRLISVIHCAILCYHRPLRRPQAIHAHQLRRGPPPAARAPAIQAQHPAHAAAEQPRQRPQQRHAKQYSGKQRNGRDCLQHSPGARAQAPPKALCPAAQAAAAAAAAAAPAPAATPWHLCTLFTRHKVTTGPLPYASVWLGK